MQALAIGSAVVGTVGTLAGAGMEAEAVKQEAEANQAVADYNTKQLRQKAGTERAISQKRYIEERRKGRLAKSRATAVAAASGAGVQNATVQNILAGLETESKYNAEMSLWEGENAARGYEDQANLEQARADYGNATANYRAKSIKRMGYMSAAGHLVSDGASFYSNYWPEEETTAPKYGDIGAGPGRTRYNWG